MTGPARTGLAERMDRRLARVLLGLILLTGGFVRLYGIDWDDGQHLHPDERFISMVEERLTRPAGLAVYFDSLRSPLNPYNHDYGSFVYGTLPLFLTKAVAGALGRTGYGGVYRVGRVLSSLFDLLTVLLVYRITRRFARREAALVAAGLFAMAPLSIQSSHFWTVETFLAAFCALALLGSVRHAQSRSGAWGDIGTGAALGLAVSCKVTALALA
ncbi:MAG: glycosyltransferase family 39 protein, partial [Thermoanaerobaculia bacterium]